MRSFRYGIVGLWKWAVPETTTTHSGTILLVRANQSMIIIILITKTAGQVNLNVQHQTVVNLVNEPLFSECYFDTDLVKRWEEYEGEGETIRTVWGHVKDYLELVDYLLGDDSNDEWNVIMAELDVDDDTEYPTRDSFMAEWIEIHLSQAS